MFHGVIEQLEFAVTPSMFGGMVQAVEAQEFDSRLRPGSIGNLPKRSQIGRGILDEDDAFDDCLRKPAIKIQRLAVIVQTVLGIGSFKPGYTGGGCDRGG